MKLKKIEDVRVGQVWKSSCGKYIYVVHCVCGDRVSIHICYLDGEVQKGHCLHERFVKQGELIGFLEITHFLENGKLVEIPRKDIEVDDVFYYKEELQIVRQVDNYMFRCDDVYGRNIYDWDLYEKDRYHKECGLTKIGTLGVNYEIVNSALGDK